MRQFQTVFLDVPLLYCGRLSQAVHPRGVAGKDQVCLFLAVSRPLARLEHQPKRLVVGVAHRLRDHPVGLGQHLEPQFWPQNRIARTNSASNKHGHEVERSKRRVCADVERRTARGVVEKNVEVAVPGQRRKRKARGRDTVPGRPPPTARLPRAWPEGR